MNFRDIWFYGNLPMSTFRDLLLLIPHCQHIKTPSDYLEWAWSDEWSTHLGTGTLVIY